MLQQTQVGRVVPKYGEFLKMFPDVRSLACAPLKRVLAVWSGLGYNRRALFLRRAAEEIVKKHHGKVPRDFEALVSLPGVGIATAAAVAAFAFNKPVVYLDTNVRSVFIREFFPRRRAVKDSEITPLVERALDTRNPREWYWALLDYGVALKRAGENPSRRSAHHAKQSPFKGSNREVRGLLVHHLVKKGKLTEQYVTGALGVSFRRVRRALAGLEREGVVVRRGRTFMLT